ARRQSDPRVLNMGYPPLMDGHDAPRRAIEAAEAKLRGEDPELFSAVAPLILIYSEPWSAFADVVAEAFGTVRGRGDDWRDVPNAVVRWCQSAARLLGDEARVRRAICAALIPVALGVPNVPS